MSGKDEMFNRDATHRCTWHLVPLLLACVIAMAAACASRPDGRAPGASAKSETPSVSDDSGASSKKTPPTLRGSKKRPDRNKPPELSALVTRVIDGDTIEVLHRGRQLEVRLIGVDTPETVHPAESLECFGRAASRFTTWSLEGKAVRLEFDVERKDRYGRSLAYIWSRGTLFNEVLVERGYAQVATYPPNVRYVDRLLVAQLEAREDDRGLWGVCRVGAGAAARSGSGGGTGRSTKGCDPSYPRVCIPPAPPDLDCGDVEFQQFAVIGRDPHSFDGDRDGVGCEG